MLLPLVIIVFKSLWKVGQARSPNIARAKKHVDTVNRKYHPKKPSSTEKLLAPSKNYKKRPKSLTMQKLDNDSRASSVRGPKYVDVEREMEKEQRRLIDNNNNKINNKNNIIIIRLVEERLELEEQRRKFMMGKVQIVIMVIMTMLIMIIGKGQEEKRMKPVGPVSIDPFADEEFYKPKNALSSSGVKIKYKYN